MNNETRIQVIPAATSIEAQQPYTIERDASRGIAGGRARDFEKTSPRSRNTKKRDTRQQIRNNQESCREYEKIDTCYPTGIACYSSVELPADIYYCRDDLNHPDMKDILHGGIESTFQCDGFSENDYIPPSAYTVTATSSTKAFRPTKIGDHYRSNGPMKLQPGFGFSSVPILEGITLGGAVVVAWVATWRCL
ncbi:hypothetical protein F5Y09DRAFT_321090 [Xylaria sp. FL1042]|nr:hypothetical protein F5Y09DRAFT_321090 [Xylaria sp. FL1042]